MCRPSMGQKEGKRATNVYGTAGAAGKWVKYGYEVCTYELLHLYL